MSAVPNRPHVVMVTSSRFWDASNGLAARTDALIRHLSIHCELSVAFVGSVSRHEMPLIQSSAHNFTLLVFGGVDLAQDAATLMQRFRQHYGSSPPAIYLIVHTELAFMLDAIPANGKTMLDSNDLISNRTQSMANHGLKDPSPLTPTQEAVLLGRFDRVICIQREEFATVSAWLGAQVAILAPHPVAANRLPLRQRPTVIGCLASVWHANVDGLRWFIEQVCPLLADKGLRLDIGGHVGNLFGGSIPPGIRFLGRVDDVSRFYSGLDIAINPVRYGAGLKIKTVEAMAHGMPLVVSPQGASGLDEVAGKAFLVGHDAASFAQHLLALVDDAALRERIAAAAFAYAAANFTADACFGPLLEQIRQLSASD